MCFLHKFENFVFKIDFRNENSMDFGAYTGGLLGFSWNLPIVNQNIENTKIQDKIGSKSNLMCTFRMLFHFAD